MGWKAALKEQQMSFPYNNYPMVNPTTSVHLHQPNSAWKEQVISSSYINPPTPSIAFSNLSELKKSLPKVESAS
jgi:hypothetical protein